MKTTLLFGLQCAFCLSQTNGHAGTLWWHAHVAMLRNTVFGGLIVLPKAGSLAGKATGRKALPVPITGASVSRTLMVLVTHS